MTRDSQQSLERSRTVSGKARAMVAGATLFTMLAADQVLNHSSDGPTKPNSEISFLDPSFAKNIFRFNPRTAFGDALWECWTTFSAKVHASKDNPTQDVRGVVLEIYNKTNPADVRRLVAVEESPYRADKQYPVNTVVEGTDKRVADIYGNPTRDEACDKKTPNIDCDETTLVIKEVGGRGASTEVKAECPNTGGKGIACDKWVAWSVEQVPQVTATPVPTPEIATPVCPPNTNMVSENPLICERVVEVPVYTQPGQAPR